MPVPPVPQLLPQPEFAPQRPRAPPPPAPRAPPQPPPGRRRAPCRPRPGPRRRPPRPPRRRRRPRPGRLRPRALPPLHPRPAGDGAAVWAGLFFREWKKKNPPEEARKRAPGCCPGGVRDGRRAGGREARAAAPRLKRSRGREGFAEKKSMFFLFWGVPEGGEPLAQAEAAVAVAVGLLEGGVEVRLAFLGLAAVSAAAHRRG